MSDQEDLTPENDEMDNLVAAMNRVAETLDPVISTSITDDDGPANKQILIRATESDHERWKLAAEKSGQSLAQFIRETVNQKVTDILDCSHPIEQRRKYPWAEFCLRCNARLRG